MQQSSSNIFKRINKVILLLSVYISMFLVKNCCKRKISVLNKLLINKVVNKVEYSHVNIFYKEKRFFANFHENIKL